MAGNRLGRYEVIKTLAKGGLTDLLLGRATGMEGFQRHVAIKLLRVEFASQPATFESFVNEARLAAFLHHHNIVQVHDIGDDGGRPYFAMEYVHGVDLRTLLAKLARLNQQLPLQHVVSVVASVAAALHHAHEQKSPSDGTPLNIVHRDVSPGNVLVGFDGNVKVVDFGIAKAAIKQISTDAGVLKGQAPYMSPEQCAGKPVDRRSDVFALGIVLYELATVRRLFKGASDFLTMSAVCNAEVPKPSQYRRDIPAQLEAIMLKALSRDPTLRFQTAGDMSMALDKIASSVGVGASTTALANYMRLQFGDQKEPWLAVATKPVDEYEETTSEVTEVDFDGAASGLAPPPSEAVERNAIPRVIAAGASKSSPIMQARTYALTPPGDKARAALPPPGVKAKPTRPPTDPFDAATTTVKRDEPDTEVDALAPTQLGKAPSELDAVIVRPSVIQEAVKPPRPTPPRGAMTPDGSATAIVQPLPVRTPSFAHPPVPRRSNRILLLTLVAMLGAGTAIAAVVFWPGGALTPSAAPEPEPVAKMEAPAPAPAAEPANASLQMTQADIERDREREREREAAAAAATAAAAKASANPKPAVAPQPPVETKPGGAPESKRDPAKTSATKPEVKEAVEPVAKKLAPPKRTTAKTPSKRTVPKTVAKAQAKPAKQPTAKKTAKKPKWDPDDLFLEDK